MKFINHKSFKLKPQNDCNTLRLSLKCLEFSVAPAVDKGSVLLFFFMLNDHLPNLFADTGWEESANLFELSLPPLILSIESPGLKLEKEGSFTQHINQTFHLPS